MCDQYHAKSTCDAPPLLRLILGYLHYLIPGGRRVGLLSLADQALKRLPIVDYVVRQEEVVSGEQLCQLLDRAADHSKERGCFVFWMRRRSPAHRYARLSRDEIKSLLRAGGWDLVVERSAIVWPFSAGRVSCLINQWLSPVVPFACHAVVYIARRRSSANEFSCSVVIPARNEAGNIRELLHRLPLFGSSQQIVLVEGGSCDATWEAIHEAVRKCEDRDIVAMKQQGVGKGPAVREALRVCRADLVFILDSDLSVDPEAMIESYEMMCLHDVDFINGTRMVCPMEMGAMRPFNWVGNKIFAFLMSCLLDRTFSDTLCGTKVFFREDFVDQDDFVTRLDPFGDFSLLIGAGGQHLRIREQAVSYRSRIYGATNIRRWRDGLRLLRIVIAALPRVKFIPYSM
ncbi:MAG: glycosyltransferase family 2 protein [Verrucomicrobia bacterium]|jgi:hypothetical protein|nr:glycosyltransferase family 2 protein [Verrucomicrobiota bacterium]MDA7667385.1 glycosyltransferase family 2 protein [bacterium]